MDSEIIPKKRGVTVFCYKILIKKENLTKEGYFNFQKINDLRILDNGFLKIIRIKYKKTQPELSKITKTPLRTVIGWQSSKKAMPFKKLIKLCNKIGMPEKEVYELIKGSEFTFGKHHGKNRIKLPLKPEEFNMANYLLPNEPNKVYAIKNTPQEIKKMIIKNFSIDNYYYKKKSLLVVYSYLLNRFLKTYYTYKKELILNFPLSKEVPQWIKEKINITRAVIIPLLITDGGEKPNCVFCSGESNIVHDIWSDACYYELEKLPSSYKVPYKTIFVTSHRLSKEILMEIKKFCPSFKTSPVNESIENYKKLSQPSISYLFKSPKLEQQIALRLWAITEGSISIHNSKKERLITPNIRIACAHPILIIELKKIAELNGINSSIGKGYNTWSGISSLQTTSISSAINFLKIGGFIRGVNVSKLRSKFFGGFDKQDVLLGIFEFMKRQREEKKYRIEDIQKINKWVKDIIENKQFNNEEYYIKYFEKC